MKVIDLNRENPSLNDVLALAGQENLILKTSEGKEFVVAEADDFDREISLVRKNETLMKLLAERSLEKKKLTLDQVKKKLGID